MSSKQMKAIIKSITVFSLLFFQSSLTVAMQKYNCQDSHHPSTKIFDSLLQFQRNSIPFSGNENFVSFNSTISRLQRNDFIAHDSNHIRKLVLNDKRIETIDNGAFNELFCVKYLLLQNNLIDEIRNGSFVGLYSVEELYLNDNNIVTLDNGTFFNLKYLLKLDLSSNKIVLLAQGSFKYLKNLWEMHLESNLLRELSYGVFKDVSHLNKLFLQNNLISTPVTADFQNLSHLDLLDIRNNGIYFLPPGIFNSLTSLSDLNIAGNRLTNLKGFEINSLQRIALEDNAWQCDDLQDILNNLQQNHISVVLHKKTYETKAPAIDIGCYNASATFTVHVSTTTGIPWFKNKSSTSSTTSALSAIPSDNDDTTKPSINSKGNLDVDKDAILLAVNNLKTVVVLLILIMVVFHVTDIMLRTNACDRFRRQAYSNRSTNRQFQFSGQSDTSLPLLIRD